MGARYISNDCMEEIAHITIIFSFAHPLQSRYSGTPVGRLSLLDAAGARCGVSGYARESPRAIPARVARDARDSRDICLCARGRGGSHLKVHAGRRVKRAICQLLFQSSEQAGRQTRPSEYQTRSKELPLEQLSTVN